MATIIKKTNKKGEVKYQFRCCVGRDEQYKQIFRNCTIPRPEGLTPAREKKEVARLADEWETAQKEDYLKTHSRSDKDKITLADFIKYHWWPDYVLDGTHTPGSVDFYRNMSNGILAWFGEKKCLKQIDAEAVKRYIKYLNTEAKTKKGKPYAASTVQHYYKTLRNILEYARRIHYIPSNPCQDLSPKEKPHREAKNVDFLAAKQAQEFLRCLESESLFWKTLINILISCGLRRGETVGLQWRDIDTEKLTIKVERSVTYDQSSPMKYRVGKTKTGKTRVVSVSKRVVDLLMDLKKEQEEAIEMTIEPTGFIFWRSGDPLKPINPQEPTRWLRKFYKRNKLPNMSPHDLRHTAATLALFSGSNLKDVQELLGHADAATTMQFYAGVTEEGKRRTAEGIEGLLSGE